MSKILIVGADGLIGHALEHRLRWHKELLVCTNSSGSGGRGKLDLSLDPDSWPPFEDIRTAYLLAGKTALEACEREPQATRLINVINTLALAHQLGSSGAHIVYVSTNLVFSGKKTAPSVDDLIEPQCRYAAEKAEVEVGLRTISSGILRITKIAESLEAIFHKWARQLAKGEIIKPFSDLVAAPVPLATVVDSLERIGSLSLDGTFHVSADRDYSYAEMAVMLARHMAVSKDLVKPVTSTEAGVSLFASPAHSVLGTRQSKAPLDQPAISAKATLEALIERVCQAI